MARDGLRVLAVARGIRDIAAAPEDPRTLGFTFLGLIGLHDPLRPDVRAAVALCQDAGMRVVMITGDHAETARAIANEAGIVEGEVLLGSELEQLDEAPSRRACCARRSSRARYRRTSCASCRRCARPGSGWR